MKLLYEFKVNSKNLYLLAICCLLHDTVEDCDVSLKTIARLFGHQVAAIVEELTSDKEKIKLIGKTAYLKEKLTKISSYSLTIKLVDRLDNCSDFSINQYDWSMKYIKETEDLIDHLYKTRKLSNTQNKIASAIFTKISEFKFEFANF